MIRINLLAFETRPEAPARNRPGWGAAPAYGGIAAGVLGLVLWQTLSLRSEASLVERRLAGLDQALAALAGVPEQRGAAERRSADLARRIARIEALRAAQAAPARLLDEVGRVLPAGVWLTELRQRGNDVTLTGQAAAMAGLADLVAGLEASAYFPLPVEIVDSRLEAPASGPARGRGVAVHFELRARFSLPAPRE